MKKVNCKNCRWFRATDVAVNYFPALAEAPRGCDVIIDCVKPKASGFANSKLKNENNDCDWYNRKHWWHRFCFENWG